MSCFSSPGASSNIDQPAAFGQEQDIGCEFLKAVWIDCRQVRENGLLFPRDRENLKLARNRVVTHPTASG